MTLFIFIGWLIQWRCSPQHKSIYLFLDKGQVAENLKQSENSAVILLPAHPASFAHKFLFQ